MEFFRHIPIYVFFIFFGLLILGISQMKTREKKFTTTLILPIAMFLFSLYGVYNLGLSYYSLIFIPGIIGGIFLGTLLWKKENFLYNKAYDSVKILGSTIPFFLIMLIFLTKFIVGMLQARNPEIIANIFVHMGFIILYGVFSGIFIQRMLLIVKLKR